MIINYVWNEISNPRHLIPSLFVNICIFHTTFVQMDNDPSRISSREKTFTNA